MLLADEPAAAAARGLGPQVFAVVRVDVAACVLGGLADVEVAGDTEAQSCGRVTGGGSHGAVVLGQDAGAWLAAGRLLPLQEGATLAVVGTSPTPVRGS